MSLTCVCVSRSASPGALGRNVVLLVSGVLAGGLATTPVLAQSGSSGTPDSAFESSAIVLLRPEAVGSPAVAHQPTTVVVDSKLRGLVDELLQESIAFRRQWQRLTRAPRLSIRIELVHAHRVGDAHAVTDLVTLPDGSLVAVVAVPGGLRRAELIAHEVEHVLERLDGVTVAARHALGDESVRRGTGTFETARAVRVGKIVAGEYRPR